MDQLLNHPNVQTLVDLALAEDIGQGDITTQSIFRAPTPVTAHIITRQATVACGLPLVCAIFKRFDPGMTFDAIAPEGRSLAAGEPLIVLHGDLRAILTAERCALNFLMRLCGLAYGAARAVAAIPRDCKARVYDTRKTTPGWRLLEKYAVKIGGAENHRVGLFDAVLIKDNHVAAAGSVSGAIAAARARVGRTMQVEVEIDTLAQLDEALAAGPDIILLDNFSDVDMTEAVRRVGGRVELEASGGVSLERLAAIAQTGVDRISMGALTHSVKPADLSLEVLG